MRRSEFGAAYFYGGGWFGSGVKFFLGNGGNIHFFRWKIILPRA